MPADVVSPVPGGILDANLSASSVISSEIKVSPPWDSKRDLLIRAKDPQGEREREREREKERPFLLQPTERKRDRLSFSQQREGETVSHSANREKERQFLNQSTEKKRDRFSSSQQRKREAVSHPANREKERPFLIQPTERRRDGFSSSQQREGETVLEACADERRVWGNSIGDGVYVRAELYHPPTCRRLLEGLVGDNTVDWFVW